MNTNNYNAILSQIVNKENHEVLITKLSVMPNGQALIPTTQNTINSLNQTINSNIGLIESRCSKLEQVLVNATKSVNDGRSYVVSISNQIKRTESSLKEILSKNKELDLKITASRTELSDLTQEVQSVSSTKSDIISNMSDKQKFFVLKKAQDNLNQKIIDLVINSGFDEQDYLNNEVEINGENEEVADIFI
jgi:chromosome segregation ATPase